MNQTTYDFLLQNRSKPTINTPIYSCEFYQRKIDTIYILFYFIGLDQKY